jgi:hypothetical protein
MKLNQLNVIKKITKIVSFDLRLLNFADLAYFPVNSF